MWPAWLSSLVIPLYCVTTFAQVPETGRWQDLSFTEEEVQSIAVMRYRELLLEMASRDRMDDDRPMLNRVRRVSASLVRAAIAVKPSSASWRWEVHTTSDASQEALCMPGGKILVGSHFVRSLGLTDGELATLIGHEVAHAVADHYREELSSVRLLDVAYPDRSLETLMAQLDTDLSIQLRLARLNRIQESEADQLGMMLAHRAGWPAFSMVSFYRKLATVDSPGFVTWTHPSADSRVGMANALAILFGQ